MLCYHLSFDFLEVYGFTLTKRLQSTLIQFPEGLVVFLCTFRLNNFILCKISFTNLIDMRLLRHCWHAWWLGALTFDHFSFCQVKCKGSSAIVWDISLLCAGHFTLCSAVQCSVFQRLLTFPRYPWNLPGTRPSSLQYIVFHCSALQCIAFYCTSLQCTAVHYTWLPYDSVLHCSSVDMTVACVTVWHPPACLADLNPVTQSGRIGGGGKWTGRSLQYWRWSNPENTRFWNYSGEILTSCGRPCVRLSGNIAAGRTTFLENHRLATD